MLDSGYIISFRITKDNFLDSLYIETIIINFNEEKEITSSEVILLCDLDYFKSSYFLIDIVENRNICFIGFKE